MDGASLDQQQRAGPEILASATQLRTPSPGEDIQPLIAAPMTIARTPLRISGCYNHGRDLSAGIPHRDRESLSETQLFPWHSPTDVQSEAPVLSA